MIAHKYIHTLQMIPRMHLIDEGSDPFPLKIIGFGSGVMAEPVRQCMYGVLHYKKLKTHLNRLMRP